MSAPETLLWLAELQARFGAVLRAPLVARDGQLVSDLAGYPARACQDILPTPQLTAAERLAIYQRQYWLRLLNLMQEQYPLCVRLLGAWCFNQYGMQFLLAHPPRHHDLGRATQGLPAFLARELPPHVRVGSFLPGSPALPRAALLEAAAIDAAFRQVFLAPEQPRWNGEDLDEAAFGRRRLQLSAAMVCLQEHWPLLALRAEVLRDTAEYALPLPPPLDRPQRWLLHRSERGVAQLWLGPFQARLLTLLSEQPVGHALACMHDEWPAAERSRLPFLIRDFFAFAARAGLFVGWCDAC